MIMNEGTTFGIAESEKILSAKNEIQRIIDRYDLFNGGILGRNISYPEESCVFAGGFFASSILDEEYNDIDMFILKDNRGFFKDLVSQSNAARSSSISGAYAEPLSPTVFGMDSFRNDRWIFRNNEKSYNYLNNDKVVYTAFDNVTRVQYILTKYNTREELLADFDMVHCTVSYVHGKEKKLYITRNAFDCIRKRTIREHNKESFRKIKAARLQKLTAKGWTRNDPINPVFRRTPLTAPHKSKIEKDIYAISTPSIKKIHEIYENNLTTPWDLQTK